MAMQTGISSSKVLILMGAAQVRRLAQEVRDLTLSRPITIVDGNSSSSGNLASYILPAAAVGAMGYCYMWWKGWSFSDVMFVTKANMFSAVASVSKQLDQVSTAVASTKRYLSHRLEILDEKVEDQAETSKVILNGVNEVKSDLSQIGFDIEAIQSMVTGLEGKIGLIESKQEYVNAGIWYLCQATGAVTDGKTSKQLQDVSSKLLLELNQSPSTFSGAPVKGLQCLTEAVDLVDVGNQKKSSILNRGMPATSMRSIFSNSHPQKGNLS